MKAGDVIGLVEEFAPPELAEEWDNVGWQVTTPEQEVTGVLLALDVTEQVVDEALQLRSNLVVSHHPLFFRPLTRLDVASYSGRLIKRLLTEEIGVYTAHTNLDVVPGGVSDALAEAMELEDIRCLGSRSWDQMEVGWGRAGRVPGGLSTQQLVQRVQSALGTPRVRVTPGAQDVHQWIAVSGGSGSHFVEDRELDPVTLYLTGEVKYHEAQLASYRGLTVIEAGHFYSERPGMERLAQAIGGGGEVYISAINTSPFE
jgi:dinuclear metal center YbgI/SA1388 family protein